MKQAASERPDPSSLRKAAIARGAARDYAGQLDVRPIPNFDLGRTIFNTLEGKLARYIVTHRVGREAHWHRDPAAAIQSEYDRARAQHPLPPVDPELLAFLEQECDFDVEHADGSFLDHLYFCFEYGVHHFPGQSPLVLLLHSILGTGTNTFAMAKEKIPQLRRFLSEAEWTHIAAFPSVLRLLYDLPLRRELHAHARQFDRLQEISFRRVIDNEPMTLSAVDFWVQLNYQLIHLVDFLPAANWSAHKSDTSFIIFRDLFGLLRDNGKLMAKVDYTPPTGRRALQGESRGLGGTLATMLPVPVAETMAAKSVRRFSERIGHDIGYRIAWR